MGTGEFIAEGGGGILLVTLCYKIQGKLWLDGRLGSYPDIIFNMCRKIQ